MKRVFLVNDTSDSVNWGCRATSRALSNLIGEAGGEIVGRVYLNRLVGPYILGRSIPAGSSFPRRALLALLRRSPMHDPGPRNAGELNRLVDRALAGSGPLAEDIAVLRLCDVMIINAEGSIYDSLKHGLMLFAYVRLAKRLGVKVALVNHTASFRGGPMAELARETVDDVDDIVVRESISAEEWTTKISPLRRYDIAADVAFTTVPMNREELARYCASSPHLTPTGASKAFDPSKPYVCVGGSSVFRRNDRGRIDPYNGYLALCTRLRAEVGQLVVVVADTPDGHLLRPIAEALQLPVAEVNMPTTAAAGLLANASALVSGRWHPSILATLGGTPCVMIEGNTHKCLALSQLFDFPFIRAGDFNERTSYIADEIQRMISQEASLRERTRAIAQTCRAQAPRHVRILLS
ncbi:MAG TPA: polysaccharide pyruvyl transferase family protein [Steroidobacteraceae bacterium]